ncbi:MFS transporter, FHS family, L-fucose permease [Parapedobacter composti]|uniref:MFS transporter, FHS family, L-fucose permease n=1 Tax=Parapedobacter composti TaxID=623281 RepID=A0A1I1E9T3_9SPHI|nr:sugar MFS transporter [Parapedobacter composti]SFB81733.1 MFS transporter, FHS family, L-fucose permease [Parapedobacter composti]
MATSQGAKSNYNVSLATLTTLFFMWGFITCMNDILIPHLKELFQLSYFQAMLVQFAFFGAYFIGSVIYFAVSYIYGDPINKIGYKGGIIIGLLISAVGCLLFYPAEILAIYNMFLLALFTLGLGFTLLQISANPYVAILGPPEGASSRLNLAQAFNSLGTTIAPVLGGYLIFEFFAQGGEITPEATKVPYLIFGLLFVLLAVLVSLIRLPRFQAEELGGGKLGALAFPQLRGGVLGIFFYVGAEVAIGSLIISFIGQPEIMGVGEQIGKNYLSLYWGGAMIGRFLGAISLNDRLAGAKKAIYMVLAAAAVFSVIYAIVDLSFTQISVFLLFILLNFAAFAIGRSVAARTLMVFALVNIVLILATVLGTGSWAMWTLLAVGLFNSIMWSNIFTLAINGLGVHTSQGASLLVMGILGGALIPLFQGWLADTIGLKPSFIIPAICYAYIAGYGLFCSRKLGNVIQADAAPGGH